jgi:hypothetical protein
MTCYRPSKLTRKVAKLFLKEKNKMARRRKNVELLKKTGGFRKDRHTPKAVKVKKATVPADWTVLFRWAATGALIVECPKCGKDCKIEAKGEFYKFSCKCGYRQTGHGKALTWQKWGTVWHGRDKVVCLSLPIA